MSGTLLLRREFPQDETARRIRSLPHILILSWVSVSVVQTAVSSMTSSVTRHLAADILGSIGASRLRKESEPPVCPGLVGWTCGGLYRPQPVSVAPSGQSLNADSAGYYKWWIGPWRKNRWVRIYQTDAPWPQGSGRAAVAGNKTWVWWWVWSLVWQTSNMSRE